jgi:hypothetical protein
MNQFFPQAPDYTNRAVSNFFQKIAEIFEAQGAPNGKNLQSEYFYYFFWTPFGSRVGT